MSLDLLPASRKVRLASWSSRWWESPTASPLRREGILNTSASASSQGIFAQRQVRPCAVARLPRATPNCPVHAAAPGVQRLPRVTGPFGELLPYDHAAAEAQLLLGEAIALPVLAHGGSPQAKFCYHCACTGGRANERGRLPASCADHNARGLPLALGWELGRARVGRAAVGDRQQRWPPRSRARTCAWSCTCVMAACASLKDARLRRSFCHETRECNPRARRAAG